MVLELLTDYFIIKSLSLAVYAVSIPLFFMFDIDVSQHFAFFFFFWAVARVQHIFGDGSKLKHEYFWGAGSIVLI